MSLPCVRLRECGARHFEPVGLTNHQQIQFPQAPPKGGHGSLSPGSAERSRPRTSSVR